MRETAALDTTTAPGSAVVAARVDVPVPSIVIVQLPLDPRPEGGQLAGLPTKASRAGWSGYASRGRTRCRDHSAASVAGARPPHADRARRDVVDARFREL